MIFCYKLCITKIFKKWSSSEHYAIAEKKITNKIMSSLLKQIDDILTKQNYIFLIS